MTVADASRQIARVLDGAGQPDDITEEAPLEVESKNDRTRQFTHTSFSRMKMSWIGDDAARLGEVHFAAAQAIKAQFGPALRVIERLYEIVRVPVVSESTGEVVRNADGSPRLMLDGRGDPVEDWTRLVERDRSNFFFTITTHLHEWERIAIQKWAEAMYAKVQWEQQFSEGYRRLPGAAISGRPTVDDRTQTGHAWSAQERYFAVFCAQISREADALIRNMVRIHRALETSVRS